MNEQLQYTFSHCSLHNKNMKTAIEDTSELPVFNFNSRKSDQNYHRNFPKQLQLSLNFNCWTQGASQVEKLHIYTHIWIYTHTCAYIFDYL